MNETKKYLDKVQPHLKSMYAQFVQHTLLAGGLYNLKTDQGPVLTHIPFALHPYKLDRKTYNILVQAQEIWTELFVKISEDREFINSCLASTIKQDTFVARLSRIYNQIQNPQKVSVSILRSDYMMDDEIEMPLMVEFNLIAVSFGPISDRIQKVTSQLVPALLPNQYNLQGFPTSHNQETICDSFAEAIRISKLKGKMIMIVKAQQGNIYDQRCIEMGMLVRGVAVIRATLLDLVEHTRVDEQTKIISYKGEQIALFYFRQGYSPDSYTGEETWKLREDIERSMALKVPTVAFQLVNFKRIQQQLCQEQVLLRYLDGGKAKKLKEVATKMWNFQDGTDALQTLKGLDLQKVILKPNREGGNHNIYGQDILDTLRNASKEQQMQYVLMRKICPKPLPNTFIRNQVPSDLQETVCQISVFNGFVIKDGVLWKSLQGGHLIRTKASETKEGGVAIQAAVLSGLYLI